MKKEIFAVLGLAVALALLMVGVSCSSPGAGPSIWTDKPDYAPEETVTISGADFTPGPVVLTVTRPDGEIEQIPDVSADSSGSFAAAYLLDGITGTYIVDATDSAGQTAQTTFTDGSTGIYAGPQVGTLTYGVPGSVTYTITVDGCGGGWTQLFIVSLPSGTTASFNPSYLEPEEWPAHSTLTISYNGTTPAGTYTICIGESPSGKPPAHHQTDPCPNLIIGGCIDADGDGYGEGPDCNGPDCDDNDDTVYPGAPELCDGKDNDCDGIVPADEVDTDGDGTLDCNDNCPNDPNKTEPGVCGCGTPDTDTDGDGTPDCNDGCDFDPNKIEPGICGCGTPDIDSDGDGTLDCNDDCPFDANKTKPGQCGCGTPDTDSDGDGTADCIDNCPCDPDKIEPGVCGCGVADTDTDGDGTPDCNDNCPNDPNKIEPGVCGCGVVDADTDGDGTPDCNDGCPADPAKTEPGVCGCGVADVDLDGDGEMDCVDLCPSDPNKVAPGICGCGTPDTDSDGDGVADCIDSCPCDPDKIEPGVCGCGVADTDTDGDGTPDCNDNCPNDPNKTEPGVCGCGVADTDTDGDGISDCNDNCPTNANPWQKDADEDGVGNVCDNCPCMFNPDQADKDGDGIGDVCDSCDDTIDTDGAGGGGEWWILMIESTEGGTVTEPTQGSIPHGGTGSIVMFLYYPDEVVNLVAVPDAGYSFVGWTGAPDIIADVADASTTITMTRDCIVTAHFAEIPETLQIPQYDLTILLSPKRWPY